MKGWMNMQSGQSQHCEILDMITITVENYEVMKTGVFCTKTDGRMGLGIFSGGGFSLGGVWYIFYRTN
jgi:hypothetical protein